MSPKQIRTRPISKGKYAVYLRKAQEFLTSMNSAVQAGHWNAAGLNAAHTAIACADALLVFYAGLRSASESHSEVLELLRLYVKDENISSKITSLGKILSAKHLAAYEDREILPAESQEIVKLAQRLFDWTQKKLG